MKLVSYNDNPDKRARDIDDFLYILENYFNIFTDKIIEDYSSVIAEKDNAQLAGAILLGKEMNLIMVSSKVLKESVIHILSNQISSHDERDIEEMYENNKDDKLFKKWKLILELKNEIQNGM